MIISFIEGQHFIFMYIEGTDIFFSWIEGRHFLFMDRGQTFFFQWMEPRYFFHTWSRPEYFFCQNQSQNIFFKKKPGPPPPPWESNGRSLTVPLKWNRSMVNTQLWYLIIHRVTIYIYVYIWSLVFSIHPNVCHAIYDDDVVLCQNCLNVSKNSTSW